MKISLNCKLDPASARDFIRQITDINFVTAVDVFRDKHALPCPKVKYHTPYFSHGGFLGQCSKLIKMFQTVKQDTQLAIGIYEIPHGMLAYLIGKIRRIPIVISIIGNPAYTTLRKGLRKKITYFMLKRTDAITVTGKKSRQFLISDGIESSSIYILPNSVDTELFKPGNEKKDFDIISLGRLSHEKELQNLLKTVAELKKERPKIKVGIAGKGQEKENLEKLINELSLQNNVEMLGFIDNVDDIINFYNSGRVFVLSSSTEGLPRTVIEAMACGVPCVASNVGDMEDLIVDGENGFLVNKYDDIDDYVTKISILLSDKNKYDQFSQFGIKFSREIFSHDAATKVWENIIKEVNVDRESVK
jgi:glycosyltransferase involved in cell wall biosynthesis